MKSSDMANETVSCSTPAAKWRELGESDPFGDRYNCPMSELVSGNIDTPTLAMMIGACVSTDMKDQCDLIIMLPYMMAGKERLRWCSRRLHELESDIVRESNNAQRSGLLFGYYSDDAMAFNLAVDGNDSKRGYDICKAAEQRLNWLASQLKKYNIEC
ncbi:hypothetical protein [Photobacterium damselae]|uniref:hypothetical protein n=1 Tax=Photobacterium damselae TaxID=38293 RepID=UPI001F44D0AC|nr:hypothetical protein [Photobacterium damselae]UKA04638.1 hypothetical protein IHC89_23755 [Photobacterium damselae subsp. damselae]